jgi:uncharacterized protein YecE (DUF72 family)
MIWIGTSGYSFRDWVGPFYPPGIPSGKMLDYYATRFRAVEINSTYYRLPHPMTMVQIERKTPEGFRFTVKLPGEVTHKRTRDPSIFLGFSRVVEPFSIAGKYHGALAQFPTSFQETPEHRDYLRFLREALPDQRVFVEFRHASWARDESYRLLQDLGFGFVSVDEPRFRVLFPPVARAVGDIGYVRLHGRNAATWWTGKGSERYNYLYTEEELQEWAAKIRVLSAQTRDTFVFFNNCHGGRAAQNAQRMEELLGL